MMGLQRAIQIMMSADTIDALRSVSCLHYERLKYGMIGYSSIRLSNASVHRLIFTEENDNLTLRLIKIDDTHYGNKK